MNDFNKTSKKFCWRKHETNLLAMYYCHDRLNTLFTRMFTKLFEVKTISILTISLLSSLSSVSHAQSTNVLSISNTGLPNYSFPIPVPPGIGSMAPKLALTYTGDAAQNGPLGYGWTVNGISRISRCNGSVKLDGYSLPVTNTVNDKLCLDGQRLIQTDANGNVINGGVIKPNATNPFQTNDSGGKVGQAQVNEYRTENDAYARIRSYGAAGNNSNNGPAYFLVWTKDGRIYEYGVNNNITSNAQIIAGGANTVVTNWVVSRISDLSNNYIDFQYTQSDVKGRTLLLNASNHIQIGREWNLAEIRYTGNTNKSQLPTNKIVFDYTTRTDKAEYYLAGAINSSTKLINNITTYINFPSNQQASIPNTALPVKIVKLSYTNNLTSQHSLLNYITECSGSGVCAPPTAFTYNSSVGNQYQLNQNFEASSLATLQIKSTSTNIIGDGGMLTGNFFGSGRQDILVWKYNSKGSAANSLYQNTGSGNFINSNNFNIQSNFFSADGCYKSYVGDFNGDGLTDILQVMQAQKSTDNSSCGVIKNNLYLSNGDGSFKVIDLTSSGIDFSQVTATYTLLKSNSVGPGPISNTVGKNFYILDVDNDGLLDIITTVLPASTGVTSNAQLCSAYRQTTSQACTRVFRGQPGGGFIEKLDTNIANVSMYETPTLNPQPNINAYTADMNRDGLTDLIVKNGVWLSTGDGNFVQAGGTNFTCPRSLDFNGDGVVDCVDNTGYLAVSDGAGNQFQIDPGVYLLALSSYAYQFFDINGDGKTDIFDTSGPNVWLSNGDGTFSRDSSFTLPMPQNLMQFGTARDFLVQDFTGNGNAEILLTTTTGTASANHLYVKSNPLPADLLRSITSPEGITTDLTWVTLSNSSIGSLGQRYWNDAGTTNAAVYPLKDVMAPIYVVATTNTKTAANRIQTDEYGYVGYKVAMDGRGSLGFRKTMQQIQTPSEQTVTKWNQYLMDSTYVGEIMETGSYIGQINTSHPQVLFSQTNFYCDTTSNTSPSSMSLTPMSPCRTSSQVRRPYLYQTIETATDLSGASLPSITTTKALNANGDPIKVVINKQVTTSGLNQNQTKTIINSYAADNTTDTNWMLGKLLGTTITSTVSNGLPSVSSGNAAYATAVKGNGPLPPTAPPSQASAIAVLPAILSLLLAD